MPRPLWLARRIAGYALRERPPSLLSRCISSHLPSLLHDNPQNREKSALSAAATKRLNQLDFAVATVEVAHAYLQSYSAINLASGAQGLAGQHAPRALLRRAVAKAGNSP
jgi:hypothetical protein